MTRKQNRLKIAKMDSKPAPPKRLPPLLTYLTKLTDHLENQVNELKK